MSVMNAPQSNNEMSSEESNKQKQQSEKPEVKGWWNKVCIIEGRLEGKYAIVTGANTGIGEMTVVELARRGCQVIMACRSEERSEEAKKRILETYGQNANSNAEVEVADESLLPYFTLIKPDQLIFEQLDLSSLASVRLFAERFASHYQKLDYLINNAGAFFQEYGTTEDGFEKTIGVNHLGHFLLTELLLPLLKKAAPSRIIIVASEMHMFGSLHFPDLQIPCEQYNPSKAYAQSKLVNVMHATELARRIEGSGILVVSLHPGVVSTEITRNLHGIYKSIHAVGKVNSLEHYSNGDSSKESSERINVRNK